MAAVYAYICKACGAHAEIELRPVGAPAMRHLVDGKVCGVFRRDYTTVHMNRVPGGGRD